MAETMIASVATNEMTDGQIEDLTNKLRDAARKHRHEAPKDAAQQALGVDNLGMRLFAVFRELVAAVSGLVVRRVENIGRAQTPKQAIKATGRKLYVVDDVVATMPGGEGEGADLIYFKPRPQAFDANGWMSPANLEAEYEFNGLKSDPRAQAKDNQDNPAFADDKPNACQWKDKDGNYCCVAFRRWRDERVVHVGRDVVGWSGGWVFAGVRKGSSASAV